MMHDAHRLQPLENMDWLLLPALFPGNNSINSSQNQTKPSKGRSSLSFELQISLRQFSNVQHYY